MFNMYEFEVHVHYKKMQHEKAVKEADLFRQLKKTPPERIPMKNVLEPFVENCRQPECGSAY
ncbi:hypothetical protein [Peribacillus sp. SCS-155]|uniref:hypothetical protein n=1 Tax=Peribacillus sedimenti TaxID=3115297 RepID=UPI00390587FF